MSSLHTLPNLRPEHAPPYGSADPRVKRLLPSMLKLEPRSVTRVRESDERQYVVCETCEACEDIPQARHEARMAREEAHIAREEARLVRDEARLVQIRAQKEIRKETRQIREEMHKMCADIYEFQQLRINEFTPMVPQRISSLKPSTTSFTPNSPKTPTAMEESELINVQEGMGQLS